MAENYKFLRRIDGSQGVPGVISLPVAAAQTVLVGQLLIMSSQQLILATASVAAPVCVAAEASAAQAAGTPIRVYPILPGQIWQAVASASPATALLGAGLYDIVNSTAQTVDVADAANGSILILATRSGVATDTNIEITFTKGYFWV